MLGFVSKIKIIYSEIPRKIRTKFGRSEESTMAGISKFIRKVHETDFIVDALRCRHTHTVRTPKNFENLSTSTRHYPPELHNSLISLLRILRKDLIGLTKFNWFKSSSWMTTHFTRCNKGKRRDIVDFTKKKKIIRIEAHFLLGG